MPLSHTEAITESNKSNIERLMCKSFSIQNPYRITLISNLPLRNISKCMMKFMIRLKNSFFFLLPQDSSIRDIANLTVHFLVGQKCKKNLLYLSFSVIFECGQQKKNFIVQNITISVQTTINALNLIK